MRKQSLAKQFVVLVLFAYATSACTDHAAADDRDVFIVSAEPQVISAGATLIIYGRGLGLGTSNASDLLAEESREMVPVGSCQLAAASDEVLVGGVPASVCYRADDRIDIRIPDIPSGPRLLVVRANGYLSNAVVIHVTR